jgi:hypothetical protein
MPAYKDGPEQGPTIVFSSQHTNEKRWCSFQNKNLFIELLSWYTDLWKRFPRIGQLG